MPFCDCRSSALALLLVLASSEAKAEQLWVEEALRRSAEIDAGLVETVPADQVIAEANCASGGSPLPPSLLP